MRSDRLAFAFGLLMAWAFTPGLPASETNVWPAWVASAPSADAPAKNWQSVGPIIFHKTLDNPANSRVDGVRPFWMARQNADGLTTEAYVLYPIFSYKADSQFRRWSFLNLINRAHPQPGAAIPQRGTARDEFDVWPFYFSRQTGDPETSYRALLPFYADITNRFNQDHLKLIAFPLYGRWEKNGVITTTAPWPFVKVVTGEASGFELWPLIGSREKPGDYREQFALWPLIYRFEKNPGTPDSDLKLGILPFYARNQDANHISETYGWPFFGYTHRTAPYTYDEKRFFWPFLVQGHGSDRTINRWAPFYTHSVIKGSEKRWFMWPLVRLQNWDESGLHQSKSQFFFILWWRLKQESIANPKLEPAHKTHMWPLFSAWNNGAGHRQLQVLSPLEPLFIHNATIRELYSPLFALYRADRQSADTARQSILFNCITWQKSPDAREFHVGPLFGASKSSSVKSFSILNGLFARTQSEQCNSWSLFWFKPPAKPAVTPDASGPAPQASGSTSSLP